LAPAPGPAGPGSGGSGSGPCEAPLLRAKALVARGVLSFHIYRLRDAVDRLFLAEYDWR
jgi:hypothetical protein